MTILIKFIIIVFTNNIVVTVIFTITIIIANIKQSLFKSLLAALSLITLISSLS